MYDDLDGRNQRDRRSERSRGWSHDRERPDKPRDSEREQGRDYQFEVDRLHDVSRSHDVRPHDHGRVRDMDVDRMFNADRPCDVDRLHDVDRSRDVDRSYDIDRSRDADRSRDVDVDRPCDVEKSLDLNRPHDPDRSYVIDRTREDHGRIIRDRENHDRVKEKTHERTRDQDRTRDLDRSQLIERNLDYGNEDRGQARDQKRDPEERWDVDKDHEHFTAKKHEANKDSMVEHSTVNNPEGGQQVDSEIAKSWTETDKVLTEKKETMNELSASKDLDPEWRKDKAREQADEQRDIKLHDAAEKCASASPVRVAPLYLDVNVTGMSPDVSSAYREVATDSGVFL